MTADEFMALTLDRKIEVLRDLGAVPAPCRIVARMQVVRTALEPPLGADRGLIRTQQYRR